MSLPEFKTLLFEIDNGIATITINRPDKMNALNNALLKELKEAIELVSNSADIRATIITGAGDKAFVAGADIKELSELGDNTGENQALFGQDVFDRIASAIKPVIAVINGYALGGGCELAMACHIRIAEENAMFGLPEVSLGLIPGYGGTQRLRRIVGKGKALEMMLTGKPIDAEEAYRQKLANQVVPSGKGIETAKDMLRIILRNGPVALGKVIAAVNASETGRKGFDNEASLFGELCATSDFKEGVSAFLEKRKPNFTGS